MSPGPARKSADVSTLVTGAQPPHGRHSFRSPIRTVCIAGRRRRYCPTGPHLDHPQRLGQRQMRGHDAQRCRGAPDLGHDSTAVAMARQIDKVGPQNVEVGMKKQDRPEEPVALRPPAQSFTVVNTAQAAIAFDTADIENTRMRRAVRVRLLQRQDVRAGSPSAPRRAGRRRSARGPPAHRRRAHDECSTSRNRDRSSAQPAPIVEPARITIPRRDWARRCRLRLSKWCWMMSPEIGHCMLRSLSPTSRRTYELVPELRR